MTLPLSQEAKDWLAMGKKFLYQDKFNIFFIDSQKKNENEKTLLLLHGFPTSSFDWVKVWPDLNKRFDRVICLDFLGYGFSDKPQNHDYTVFEETDIVEALLKSLNVKTISILAHDYGVTVGQELVSRYYDRLDKKDQDMLDIKSICYLNGGIIPEAHRPRLVQKLLLNPVLGPIITKLITYPKFRKSLAEILGPDTQFTEQEFSDIWRIMGYNNGLLVYNRLIKYITQRRENRDRWVNAIVREGIPHILINGPADPVSGAHILEYYKKLVKNPKFVSLGEKIGHYPNIEDPKGVLQAYDEFLRTITY